MSQRDEFRQRYLSEMADQLISQRARPRGPAAPPPPLEQPFMAADDKRDAEAVPQMLEILRKRLDRRDVTGSGSGRDVDEGEEL